MALEITLIVLSFVLVLVGFLGIIAPFLPGVPLAWLGMLVFGYATGFIALSLKTILIFLLLSLFTVVLDFLMPALGAKKYKASWHGVLGSFAGLILGFVAFGPIGMVLGPIAGAFLGEILAGRKSHEAMNAVKGALIGTVLNSILKLSLVLAMLGFLVVATFKIIF